jgi:predicted AlkP superfamily pyrophosphatase or phosphodiesterase
MRGTEACGLGLLGFCFLVGLNRFGPPDPPQKQPATPHVRLAVLIVVDQLRGDFLTRWDRLFGDRGFRRLEREGTWFQNCYYPYASTYTAAGHTSVATGCSPRTHGIIGNDWYDRDTGEVVSAAGALDVREVPYIESKGTSKKPVFGGSPHHIRVETLADALKEATRGKGKVVVLSLKDRAAVPMGGKHPDACYWLHSRSGMFVTSTYYRARLHPWVEEFNRARPADRWLGSQWERLRDDLDYDLHATIDDVDGEGTGFAQGRTFPHPFADKPTDKFYEAVVNSPFGNTLLVDLAMNAVEAESLGQDDVPDLLALSFSSNDVVGHCWGPDSHEALDVTLRTDRELQRLLLFLDDKVGKGNYVVALTADHGVCPLAEVARAQGHKAGRLEPRLMVRKAEDYLQRKYGKSSAPAVEMLVLHDLYLGQTWLRAKGLKREEVEKELAAWAREQPQVEAAYTRTELMHPAREEDDILRRRVRRSFDAERNGDVIVVLKPYHYFWDYFKGGTTHGSPHDYDRHVPLLVMGPGVRGGVSKEEVTPQSAAVILAKLLGIQPPASAEVGVPKGLFKGQP